MTDNTPTTKQEEGGHVECRACRFGVLMPRMEFHEFPGMTAKHEHVMCRFYPKAIETHPRHWCGQGLPA